MTTNSFAMPIDVPWYLIAASPDMMTTSFCTDATDDSDAYPPAWHSSLAIYAYEPSPDDLPAELCNQKITYLKVTCSITGFQPTAQEASTLAGSPYNFASAYSNPPPFELAFPNAPGGADIDSAQDFGDFLNPYFACYGVLLNVKVVPSVTTVPKVTPSSSSTISIASTNPSLSNPYTAAPDGTTFTVAGRVGLASSIRLVSIPGTRSRGIVLALGQTLEIDLPLSTNITIAMYASGRNRTIGTVTAYEFATQTYSAPLKTGSSGGVTQFQIPNASATRVVISASAPDISFVSISYASLERPTTVGDYPHIIDFEPKTRDLYQSVTDQAEMLTGSNSSINTGKSLTNTATSQMGLGLEGTAQGTAYGVTLGGKADLTSSWGNTTSDTSNTQIDASRQSRETQGSTTNLTQQYNLLTGYHAGTNRAAFLMLPRPHTLQATDYRTFIRGLRMIEGVQEFFLVVSRPLDLPGICIEATLETGHFPEDVTTATPQTPPAPTTVQVFPGQSVNIKGSSNPLGGTSATATNFSCTVDSPWIIDTTQTSAPSTPTPPGADPSVPWKFLTPGVFYTYGPLSGDTTNSNEYKQATGSFAIGANQSNSTGVTGTIWVTPGGFGSYGNVQGTDAAIQVWIAICETQPAQTPAPPVDKEPVVVSPFLVTSRDLCVCINSCAIDNCVMIAPLQQVPYGQSPGPVVSTSSDNGSSAGAGAAGGSSGGGTSSGASTGGAQAGASQAVAAAVPARPPKRTQYAGLRTQPVRRPAPPSPTKQHGTPGRSSIVYESKIKISPQLLRPENLRKSRTPVAREIMYQIQHHMLSNWRLPHRRPSHSVGYLDSDFVTGQLVKFLSRNYLSRSVADVKGLSRRVVENLGRRATVGKVLALDLYGLCRVAKVGLDEAVKTRRVLLGFVERETPGPDRHASGESGGDATVPRRRQKRAGRAKRIRKTGG